ncbi:hypothetical protein HZS_4239 [Henneguya salminicola]|nr:hypothetical protein HZS_4239 [Henneguya salminicola]
MKPLTNVRINRIDRNFKTYVFLIRINSIFWNTYKKSSGDCCSTEEEKICTIPCDFHLSLLLPIGDITSNYIIGNTERQGYYGFNIFNFICLVKHRDIYNAIDSVIFSNIQNAPNKIYNFNNLNGHRSNIVMNVSYG